MSLWDLFLRAWLCAEEGRSYVKIEVFGFSSGAKHISLFWCPSDGKRGTWLWHANLTTSPSCKKRRLQYCSPSI